MSPSPPEIDIPSASVFWISKSLSRSERLPTPDLLALDLDTSLLTIPGIDSKSL
jgi:hypothetical protein